jgi:hypothetical protein
LSVNGFVIGVNSAREALRNAAWLPSMTTDFSGEYVLNREASALSPGAAAIERARLRIEHREPLFRCWATFFVAGGQALEYSFERATDGREVAVGEHESCRMCWQGDALVSEDRSGTPDSAVTMSWRYELLDDGRRLRAVERIRGSERSQDNVWEFERQ